MAGPLKNVIRKIHSNTGQYSYHLCPCIFQFSHTQSCFIFGVAAIIQTALTAPGELAAEDHLPQEKVPFSYVSGAVLQPALRPT